MISSGHRPGHSPRCPAHLAIFSWKSTELGNEANRNVFGVLDTRVDELGIAHCVEQLIAEFSREGFERSDRSRSECRKQESTGDFVERRIGSNWRSDANRCR